MTFTRMATPTGFSFPGVTFLNTVKAARAIFGLGSDLFAPPLFALDDVDKEKVRKILDQLGIDRSTLG